MTNFQFIRKEAIILLDDILAAHNEANATRFFDRLPKARDGDPLIYRPNFVKDVFGLSFTFKKINQGLCSERFDGRLNSKIMVTAFVEGDAKENYFYHQDVANPDDGRWVVFATDEGAGVLELADLPDEFEPSEADLTGLVGGLMSQY